MNALPEVLRERACEAVAAVVLDKVSNYLGSAFKADQAA